MEFRDRHLIELRTRQVQLIHRVSLHQICLAGDPQGHIESGRLFVQERYDRDLLRGKDH